MVNFEQGMNYMHPHSLCNRHEDTVCVCVEYPLWKYGLSIMFCFTYFLFREYEEKLRREIAEKEESQKKEEEERKRREDEEIQKMEEKKRRVRL